MTARAFSCGTTMRQHTPGPWHDAVAQRFGEIGKYRESFIEDAMQKQFGLSAREARLIYFWCNAPVRHIACPVVRP